jgi:hypothetical protein
MEGPGDRSQRPRGMAQPTKEVGQNIRPKAHPLRWRDLAGPGDPRNFLRVVEDAAKTAGVEGVVGVHSAAVGWLEAGVHIKAVADMALVHLDYRRHLRPYVR